VTIRVTEVLVRAGLIDASFYTELGKIRGSYVHRACELDDLGQLDESTVDEQIRGRLEAWRRFKSDFRPTFTAIEHRIDSPALGLSGQPDRIANDDAGAWIIDLKSGGEAPWQGVQLGGYAYLHGWKPRITNVYLRESGTYSMRDWSLRENEALFLAAFRIARWKQENGL